jgi:hypothetical protein
VAQQADPFGTLGSVLKKTVLAVGAVMGANGMRPQPGSQAATERSQEGQLINSWRESPVQDAHALPQLRLVAGVHHIQGLERTLQHTPLSYAATMPARAILETSALALWGFDLSLDTRGRVLRAFNDYFRSYCQLLPLGGRDIEDFAVKRLHRLLRGAEELGFEIDRTKGGKPKGIVGVVIPGPTALIRQELGEHDAFTYRALSGIAHGDISGLVRNLQQVSEIPQEPTMVFATPEPDARSIALYTSVAFLAFWSANERRMAFFGWDDHEWQRWKGGALQALRPLLG